MVREQDFRNSTLARRSTMTRLEFRYSRLTGVIAILAVMFMPAIWVSKAIEQPSLATADVANEQRVITKYFEDLVTYDKQATEFGKRSTFLLADLEPLKKRSDDLKGRLSAVQNSVRELVRKLKAANEWEDLDTSLAATITDAKQKSFFQQTSFKRLFDDSANNLSSHGNEISAPLDNLRKRLTSRSGDGEFQIVRVAYEAPALATLHHRNHLRLHGAGGGADHCFAWRNDLLLARRHQCVPDLRQPRQSPPG
jgi:membrane-associated HD superfamily phosphohydrolase